MKLDFKWIVKAEEEIRRDSLGFLIFVKTSKEGICRQQINKWHGFCFLLDSVPVSRVKSMELEFGNGELWLTMKEKEDCLNLEYRQDIFR